MEDGKLDPSSPYYLGSDDQPGNTITHVILKGDNYLAWSRAITLSLKSRRKFVFINGTITKPTKKKLLDLETVNSMLVSWILRTTDLILVASIPYFEEAKRLWDYLEHRFCVSNGLRIQQLCAKITDCKQLSSMSIEEYYTKLIGLFDDLTRLKPPHGCECGLCTCDVAGKYATDREEEVFHQFLIGIDDTLYTVVHTNLLSQQPAADLNRAYQTLLQEEESRGIGRGKAELDRTKESAHAFFVSSARWKGASDRQDKAKLYCSHCQKKGT
uniref:Retrotransposon Copia-like N-terminal domain-containing protein n=1 Tax=Chenopodium quinoa TaxID=63459 RepID=A0A803M6X4_CHEQI